jgi:Fe-S oxidoreductase
LLPFKPNGKPQHVKGFLAKFAKTAKSTADFLNKVHELNIPMIGLDASLALCYRDEYCQILGDSRGKFSVELAHEWLITILDHQNKVENETELAKSISYKLFAHCTEKTALAGSEGQWKGIFAHFGLSLTNVSVGCCGMAGTYGHEKVNLDNSKALYDMSWKNKVSELATEQILVTGYSCRSQIKRLDNKVTLHPVQALLNTLN